MSLAALASWSPLKTSKIEPKIGPAQALPILQNFQTKGFQSLNPKKALKVAQIINTSLLNCYPKGLGEECPLADYFLLEAQSDTTKRRRRGKREVRGGTPESPSSAEDRLSTVPEKGSGGTKEAGRGWQRQQQKLAEQKRSRAVHSGGENRRRRVVQRRRRPPQTPNRRYWLNVSKNMFTIWVGLD